MLTAYPFGNNSPYFMWEPTLMFLDHDKPDAKPAKPGHAQSDPFC